MRSNRLIPKRPDGVIGRIECIAQYSRRYWSESLYSDKNCDRSIRTKNSATREMVRPIGVEGQGEVSQIRILGSELVSGHFGVRSSDFGISGNFKADFRICPQRLGEIAA